MDIKQPVNGNITAVHKGCSRPRQECAFPAALRGCEAAAINHRLKVVPGNTEHAAAVGIEENALRRKELSTKACEEKEGRILRYKRGVLDDKTTLVIKNHRINLGRKIRWLERLQVNENRRGRRQFYRSGSHVGQRRQQDDGSNLG